MLTAASNNEPPEANAAASRTIRSENWTTRILMYNGIETGINIKFESNGNERRLWKSQREDANIDLQGAKKKRR